MLHRDGRGGGGNSSGDEQPQRPSVDLTSTTRLNRPQQFKEPYGELRVKPSHSSPPGDRKGLVKAERDSEGDRDDDDDGDVKFSRRHSEPSRRVSSSASLKSRKKRSSPEITATRGCIDINSSPAKKTSRASPTKRRRVGASGRTSSTAATAHHASRAASFAAASAAAAAAAAAPAVSKGAGQTSSQLSDLIRRLPSPTRESRWTFEMNAQLQREMQIHTTTPVTTATTTAAGPTNTAAAPPAAGAFGGGLDAAAIAEAIMRQRGMATVAQRFAHPESEALSPRFGSEAHARRFGWPEAWTERFGRPEAHAHRPGSEPLNRSLYEAAAALGAEGAAAEGSTSSLSGQCKLSTSHAAASGAALAAAATAAAAATTTRISTISRALGSIKVRRSTSATAPVATAPVPAPAPATATATRSAATTPTATTTTASATASATERHPLSQPRPNALARAAAAASLALPNFSLLSSIMAAAAASTTASTAASTAAETGADPPFHAFPRAHTAPPLRSNLGAPSPLSPGAFPTSGASIFPASSSVPGTRPANHGPDPAGLASLVSYPARRPSPSVAGAGAASTGATAGAEARAGSVRAGVARAGSAGAGSAKASSAGAAAGGLASTVGNNSSSNNGNNDGMGMSVESLPVLRVSSDSNRMVVPRSAWAQGLVVDHMLGRGPMAAALSMHDAPDAHAPMASPSIHDAPALATSAWAQGLVVDHMLGRGPMAAAPSIHDAAAAANAAAATAAATAAPPAPAAAPTSHPAAPPCPLDTLRLSTHQVFPPALLAHMHLLALQTGQHMDLRTLQAGQHTLLPQGFSPILDASALGLLGPSTAALQPVGAGTVGEMAAATAGPFSAAAWATIGPSTVALQPAGACTAGEMAPATAGPFSAASWAGLDRQAAALQPAGSGTGGEVAGGGIAATAASPFSAAAWAGLERQAAALQPAGAGTEGETAGRGAAAATATPFPSGADTPTLQGRSSEVTNFGPGALTQQGNSSQGVEAERGSGGLASLIATTSDTAAIGVASAKRAERCLLGNTTPCTLHGVVARRQKEHGLFLCTSRVTSLAAPHAAPAAHAACRQPVRRHEQPAAARAARSQVQPAASCSKPPHAASSLTQPSGRSCLLPHCCLPACPLAACCRLPAACLLPACCLPTADHFLALDPTTLTVDDFEKHLLAAEKNILAVGAARGTPRSPLFEGCSPSPLTPSYASAAAAHDYLGAERVRAASAPSGKRRSGKGGRGGRGGGGGGGGGGGAGGGGGGGGGGGRGGGGGGGGGGDGGGTGSGGGGSSGSGGGGSGSGIGGQGQQQPQQQQQQHQRQHQTPTSQQLLDWYAGRGASGGPGRCPYIIRTGPRAGRQCTGACESAPLGTALAQALHTFTLDSGASRCFFRDSTTVTPLPAPFPVSLADPSGGPVLAQSSTVLPCPAVPSGELSGLHLPSFSTNLVSNAVLQDAGVDTFTPSRQRVAICTCSQTGQHLATFARAPGSNLYTLTTASRSTPLSPQLHASAQVATQCECRRVSHDTLLWHHRLGHPSLPRLRSMHSRFLVSGLPRSLPPLPPSPAPPCIPCVEGRQCATPHSFSFPPIEAPLQTLHVDVWGPARVRGQDHERYFLQVVDDYTRYTTVFPLQRKGDVPDVLIPWIRATHLQLRERFQSDFPVLLLHSDRGGELSSDLLAAFCAEHGIRQTFTLPASPQHNGVAERRIGLVMEVARTSMIHAAAPHFLWPFAVRYAAHQLNLWPRVSLPETSPTLLWTGKVGDASRFRVWGARAFVRDTIADKLSPRAIPCFFLGFVPDAPGWQFYDPALRRVFASQDVTFDESVPFYRLFPYRTAPRPPPPPLFLAPGPPQVDPLPAPCPAPSSDGGECALGTDVLEDRQEDLECLAAAAPHLVSMLLAPEGDPDAPYIPTPRSYAEAIADHPRQSMPHITLTQSHMVQQVLQRFGFTWSSAQATPLATGHSLSAPPSDESVEPSGLYPELVGCLMYLMACTRPDLAYPLGLLARYVAPGRHRNVHMDAAKRVLRYLCSTSGMGLVLGGRGDVVLTGHSDASWVDDQATQRSSQGYTFSLGSGSVSWRSTRSSSVLDSSCEAEIYATAMAAQELRWLTYLLTDLGERPRSPPVLYVDNKAAIALCQEHRLEHRTKHIALRYFLARELQQRGQLRLTYVATRANTADIFTKALPLGDHQRFCALCRDPRPDERLDGRELGPGLDLPSAGPVLAAVEGRGRQPQGYATGARLLQGPPHRRGRPDDVNLQDHLCSDPWWPHSASATPRRVDKPRIQSGGPPPLLNLVRGGWNHLQHVRWWIDESWADVPEELVRKAFLTCGISNAEDGSENHLILAHLRDKAEVEVLEDVQEEEMEELIPNPFYPDLAVAPADSYVDAEDLEAAADASTGDEDDDEGHVGDEDEWSDDGDDWWAPGRYEGEEVEEWVAGEEDG
ncbi:unnamed protein product [Closterium sp. NIES-54]